MRKIRKILIVLLSILLIVSYSSIAIAAPAEHTSGASADHAGKKGKITDEITDENDELENPTETPEEEVESKGNGNNDDTLNIVKVNTDQMITFDWDLVGALVAQEKSNNGITDALFQIQALRYVESNDLTVSVEAELSKEITTDTVTVMLGDNVDDNFEDIKTYEISEFTQTTIDGSSILSLNIVVNLLDFSEEELALLQKIRLSIPVESKHGNVTTLIATHELSLSETPTTVNAEAEIETNLLDVLAGLGTIEVEEDDWTVSEDKLDDNSLFNEEIQFSLNTVRDAKDMIVTAKIIGDNGIVLNTIDVSLGSGQDGQLQDVWDGETHHIHGFWLPPVTENFVLDRNTVQIKFWLETKPTEPISLQIFESDIDELENLIIGDPVTEIAQEDIRTRNCGNHSRTWGENQPGGYYKFILKYKNLPSLEIGNTYILAVMIGDEILAFDEDSAAMLSFEVSEDASAAKNTSKASFTRAPKRTGSKRSN